MVSVMVTVPRSTSAIIASAESGLSAELKAVTNMSVTSMSSETQLPTSFAVMILSVACEMRSALS